MRTRRTALASLAVGGGVVAGVAVLPVVAAAGDTTAETLIDTLADRLLVLGATIALIAEGALLYALLRFRGSGTAATPEFNSRFHVAYVLAVGLVLFFVGFSSLQTLAALNEQAGQPPPEDAVQVDVVAQQWAWTFEYPANNATSFGTLVIPVDQTVYLRLTSRDVVHAFYAPELGLKRDANPALWNALTFTPTETGEYELKCAEYCGQGHARMRGTVRVVNDTAYENWLEERGSTTGAVRADGSR